MAQHPAPPQPAPGAGGDLHLRTGAGCTREPRRHDAPRGRRGILIRLPSSTKRAKFVVAVLLACVGLAADGAPQAATDAEPRADDGVAETEAPDGSDIPGVTGKTYGGKASAAYVVRKRTALRRQAAQAVPRTGHSFGDWINGPSGLGDWAGARRPLERRGITLSGFTATAMLGNATGGARRSWTVSPTRPWSRSMWTSTSWWDGRVSWSARRAGGRAATTSRTRAASTICSTRPARTRRTASTSGSCTPSSTCSTRNWCCRSDGSRAATISRACRSRRTTCRRRSMPSRSACPPTPCRSQACPRASGAPSPRQLRLAEIELTAGVYNADRRSSELNGTHGVDFGLDLERGVMVIGQASYLREQAKGDRGLPGIYSFGGFHAGDRYRRINGSGDKDGNFGFYAMSQQMVYREGAPGSAEGLTLWLAVAYQPQESINLLPVILASWRGVRRPAARARHRHRRPRPLSRRTQRRSRGRGR